MVGQTWVSTIARGGRARWNSGLVGVGVGARLPVAGELLGHLYEVLGVAVADFGTRALPYGWRAASGRRVELAG